MALFSSNKTLWLLRLSVFLWVATSCSLASPVVKRRSPSSRLRFTRRAAPVIPADDPFYTPPAGYASKPNGAILNSRSVEVATFGDDRLNLQAYQLLYKTSSQNGTALATVTTVFKPDNASTTKLVGYATAEDSDNTMCAPSYNYQYGSNQTNGIIESETLILEGALNMGWIVSSPDYEGPDSAFSAGHLSGQGVLDALRACLQFAPLGLNVAETKIAAFGYSGGAIATGWAAALQPTYAPDLTPKIVGWAHGGTPANVSGTLSYLDGTLFSGFGFAGVAGLAQAYSNLSALVNQIATPAGKAAVASVRKNCGTTDIENFAFKKFQSTYYQTAGTQVLYLPTVMNVTNQNILGTNATETPGAPLFIYHAVHDEIIPIANADTMVQNYCAHGVKSLLYQRDNAPTEHASEEFLAAPAVLAFLRDRLNGVPATKGCVIQNVVTTLFDPGALGAGLELVLGDLLNILGQQVGLEDQILKGKLTAAAARKRV